MSESDTTDVEREKNCSFELGHISQLEDMVEELREEAGELWANGRRSDSKKAKVLKRKASEYEERAQERRSQWESEYKDTDN